MADITIRKHDETYCKVRADAGIMLELSDYFTFDVPGAKFMPLYKLGRWDGKIRLFNRYSGQIYLGLADCIIRDFAEPRDYSVKIEFDIAGDEIDIDEWEQFTESLDIHSKGEPITLHDYQIAAGHTGVADARVLLVSPTASGKSGIIYTMARWHEMAGRRQLIVVPTTSLVEQMYSDFADYSTHNGWDVETSCARIYSGKDKFPKQSIVIATWQTLVKLPVDYFDNFDVVYMDECHLGDAKSLTKIMENTRRSKFKAGLTGTLKEAKTHRLVLEGLFGKIVQVTSTKHLIDAGIIAPLNVFCITLKWPKQFGQYVTKLPYKDEIDFIVGLESRNKYIRNLALKCTGNTLVFVNMVEKHGTPLYEMISEAAEGRPVYFVDMHVKATEREKIRADVENADNAIIVATYQTFSTGINIKKLDNIIFASPSKSRVRVLQSIGRGLRKAKNKTLCRIFDIADDLSSGKTRNTTLKHQDERIKMYNIESFDYQMSDVVMSGEMSVS